MRPLFALILMCGVPSSAQELTLREAVALALERNSGIIIEREALTIADASVLRAEAAYEPTLRGEASIGGRTDPMNSILSGAPAGEPGPTTNTWQTSASVGRLLPTGATVSLFSGLHRDRTNSRLSLLTPAWSTLAGMEVRQPLMQNRRVDPARRAIRIALADRTRAVSSLRRVAIEITAAVERAWWSIAAARADLGLRESAVALAEKQREDTRVRVEAGTQPEADLAQTDAEIERRRGELSVARENLTRSENLLRSLVARDAVDPVWDVALAVESRPPDARPSAPDIATAVAAALQHRADLEELTTGLQRSDIDIEWALDRLQPQVDLVASWTSRGLGGTPNENALEPFGPLVVPEELSGGLGASLQTLAAHEFPDASIGIAVVLPIGNSAAKQDVVIARAHRRQTEATLDAARKRVALEVRNAIAALESSSRRIESAAAAVAAAEMQLQAERDRFEGGVSNMFFILTRQNELTAAQASQTIAINDYRKAETELARAMGTLLEQRDIYVEAGVQR